MWENTNEEEQALLTDSFLIGLELEEKIRRGTPLEDALSGLETSVDSLEDDYPEWHPAPFAFEGMVKLYLYRETTGWSYRKIARIPQLSNAFGLGEMPSESAMSRTWRYRFDDMARLFIRKAAHYLVKQIHDYSWDAAEIRPSPRSLRTKTLRTKTTRATKSPSLRRR